MLLFYFKGLKLLLNAAEDKLIDIDKVLESKTDVSWLLTSLPQLPNFPAFKSQVSGKFIVVLLFLSFFNLKFEILIYLQNTNFLNTFICIILFNYYF